MTRPDLALMFASILHGIDRARRVGDTARVRDLRWHLAVLWAAWCLHRDRAIVRDAVRAHAAGRSVQVLALVAPWSTTHGTEYTAERARRAGLEVVVRRYGEG